MTTSSQSITRLVPPWLILSLIHSRSILRSTLYSTRLSLYLNGFVSVFGEGEEMEQDREFFRLAVPVFFLQRLVTLENWRGQGLRRRNQHSKMCGHYFSLWTNDKSIETRLCVMRASLLFLASLPNICSMSSYIFLFSTPKLHGGQNKAPLKERDPQRKRLNCAA